MIIDWKSDWLYALVLRQAEDLWVRCKCDLDQWHWRYVLIEEWSGLHAQGASCEGEVARAWVRNDKGLGGITLIEYERLVLEIDDSPLYPFILMEFQIHPGRQTVAIGHRDGWMGGQGYRYLVRGEGEQATLEFDASSGFWKS